MAEATAAVVAGAEVTAEEAVAVADAAAVVTAAIGSLIEFRSSAISQELAETTFRRAKSKPYPLTEFQAMAVCCFSR
jgi:hypothetical protein